MGFVIIAAIAIIGAALIVGGIVGYRKSESAMGKAVSAGSVAAGVVMCAIVLFVVPVSVSTG